MHGGGESVNGRRDLLVSVGVLSIVITFALIGLTLDHNWPKILRVALAFSTYSVVLITLCRSSHYDLRWRWFVASSTCAGIVSGVVRPEFHLGTLIGGMIAGGLLLGSAHWLGLKYWRQLLPVPRSTFSM